MARRPGLRCKCGAFAMIDDTHAIEHGRPPGKKHTATACDHDAKALNHREANLLGISHQRHQHKRLGEMLGGAPVHRLGPVVLK